MALDMTTGALAELLGVRIDTPAVQVNGAVIDSRQVRPGDLFIALKGERVDGHDFIARAREAGAAAALVSELRDDPLPQLQVADVRAAFARIAGHWRAQCAPKLVAITGSNGKTTLKEMVSAILREVGSVTATAGNLNNDLGVPLTLCRLNRDDDYAVVEMGANHPGEIAALVEMAAPDVAVINNVAPAHLEGFGSEQGVAEAKGEILAGLPPHGTGIINADMPYVRLWRALLGERRTISFALQESTADIHAEYVQLAGATGNFMIDLEGVKHYVELPLPGMHNIANALAAIAVCRALDVPVEAMVRGLAAMKAVPHRLQLRAAFNGSRIIDDSYNANPGSFTQALNTLTAFDGRHWLVLGDFGELGDNSRNVHAALGSQARQAGVERLLTLGEQSRLAAESFGEGARHFEDSAALLDALKRELAADVVCLIKGSRFMKLDQLADALAPTEGQH